MPIAMLLEAQTTSQPLTREGARAIDRAFEKRLGLSAELLMENAGRAVAVETDRLARRRRAERVLVLAGAGNNGADGAVAARHLAGDWSVELLTVCGRGALRGLSRLQVDRARACGVKVAVLRTVESLRARGRARVVVVDALFGVGLDRPVEGFLRRVIEALNELGVPVVAVDVPSGLDPDTGVPLGCAVHATLTVTFVGSKIGFRAPAARRYTGRVVVCGIGAPAASGIAPRP